MITSLIESPWPALIAGAFVEAILIVALLNTGRGRLVWAMIGVLAVVAGLVVMERLIVTDKEAIGATLDGAVAALEANNVQAVLAFVSPKSTEKQAEIRGVMSMVQVTEARITSDPKIEIHETGNPPTADVDFMARANVKMRQGEMLYDNLIGRVEVELEKNGDAWLITDFDYDPPRMGGR